MLSPKLLLLDEPAAGMNSQEARSLSEQIRFLRDQMGLTVVLVEHNMAVVMSVCDACTWSITARRSPRAAPRGQNPKVLAAYLGKKLRRKRRGMSAESALELSDVSVSYGGIAACKGISLRSSRARS